MAVYRPAPASAALPELEWESEWEGEWEGELESEQFFRQLAGLARRAVTSPRLRNIARRAVHQARRGANILRILNLVRHPLPMPVVPPPRYDPPPIVRRVETSGESEWEGELEYEGAYELNPIRRVYPDALMEHLGHAAAEAESEAEAEAFIGALIPLAARLVPRIAPAVMRAGPALVRGVSGVVRTLRSQPGARPLVRTVPTILRRTMADLSRQTASGQSISMPSAARTLARQTARVLGNPGQAVRAFQRSRALDRQYHRAAASTSGRRPCVCRRSGQ
jgi:hypothetical protein